MENKQEFAVIAYSDDVVTIEKEEGLKNYKKDKLRVRLAVNREKIKLIRVMRHDI